MADRAPLSQFLRYGVVGVGTNLAGYLVYLAITGAGAPPKWAMTGLYAFGATLSFLLNRRWTFGHTGGISGAGLRFALAHLIGYAANFTLLYTFHDRLGLPHQAVQAAAVLIVAVLLFALFRLFVFPARTAS